MAKKEEKEKLVKQVEEKAEENIVLDKSPVIDEIVEENIDATEIPEEESKEVEEKAEEIKLDEVKEEIQVIDMNNNPVSLLATGDISAPRGFVPTPTKTKIGEYNCLNGRTDQITGKDTAMWGDNGKVFALSNIADEKR